jgi:hypothetical protein
MNHEALPGLSWEIMGFILLREGARMHPGFCRDAASDVSTSDAGYFSQ